ncbi:thiosulfate oxidation carrier protein SoxY [Iodidimonas sp. SYSU 1G8]|uniref:thiosulfate oxidation carrier protein SoxY n=1 Tax=Iodidimonas sp. SYSU 1G8 TaxID=3133967 RepID=UPI0031FE4CBE
MALNGVVGTTRRGVVLGGAVCLIAALMPLGSLAAEADMRAAITGLFGDRPLREGGISLIIPPLAENGNSVPLAISVDSPMTETDHVRRIAVFSPLNPLPDIIQFELGPRAGKASVSTRIRLARTQDILVVAELSDGSLRSASASIMVTVGACIVG